jgi:hypothetical protein
MKASRSSIPRSVAAFAIVRLGFDAGADADIFVTKI